MRQFKLHRFIGCISKPGNGHSKMPRKVLCNNMYLARRIYVAAWHQHCFGRPAKFHLAIHDERWSSRFFDMQSIFLEVHVSLMQLLYRLYGPQTTSLYHGLTSHPHQARSFGWLSSWAESDLLIFVFSATNHNFVLQFEILNIPKQIKEIRV